MIWLLIWNFESDIDILIFFPKSEKYQMFQQILNDSRTPYFVELKLRYEFSSLIHLCIIVRG